MAMVYKSEAVNGSKLHRSAGTFGWTAEARHPVYYMRATTGLLTS